MSKNNDKKPNDDVVTGKRPVEFLKPKFKEDKSKGQKMQASPSPHEPMVPCIKCGKTHRKGARCNPG